MLLTLARGLEDTGEPLGLAAAFRGLEDDVRDPLCSFVPLTLVARPPVSL